MLLAPRGRLSWQAMSDDDYEEFDDDFDPERPPGRLDKREAALVRRDLDDLASFRQAFEAEGFKGVSLFCADCVEEHYYGWDMLEHNLQALLESGESPVHEPAFDPRPDEYVDWEYAQGYLDGLADAGVAATVGEAGLLTSPEGGCPFCGASLPEKGAQASFCPTCGHDLAPARIARLLLEHGWSQDDVARVLRTAGVPPLLGLMES